jgi:hypothetical protein
MGKKKIIDPSTIVAIDDAAPEPMDTPVREKKKREISDKQRENLKKGMMALKAKREARRATQDTDTEASQVSQTPSTPISAPPTPPANITPLPVIKERKPRADKGAVRVPKPPPVSRDDFDSFKRDLMTSLTPQEKIIEKTIDRPVDRFVDRVVEKHTTKFVSGSDMLDAIFFK